VSVAPAFWAAADAVSTFRALDLDSESLEALARRRLSQLLQHAARYNDFCAQRLREAGVKWDDPILQREPHRALAALPPVSKQELRQAGAAALDGGAVARGWHSSTSSGSTGEPFRVYYEPRAWATLKHLVKLRARRACGVRVTDRVAVLDALVPRPPSQFGRWTRISVLQPGSAVASALTTFAPDVLYGLPSALREVAQVLERRGHLPDIYAVFTSGELLDRATREALRAAFDAPVYDIYGTSETKEIAWECPEGGMHVNADVVRLEALDESGNALPPGVEGDLVATVLVNRAMPLLRYRTGDRGTLLAKSCPCGRSSPLVGVVTGRAADVLVLRGGQRISPYALTCALERIEGVLRYQVSQLDPGRVRVRAILETAVDRDLVAAKMRHALRLAVAPFLDADVEFVDRFPRGPRAKFRVVQPLQADAVVPVSSFV
jgi:phenylacetate-CoA ligase